MFLAPLELRLGQLLVEEREHLGEVWLDREERLPWAAPAQSLGLPSVELSGSARALALAEMPVITWVIE